MESDLPARSVFLRQIKLALLCVFVTGFPLAHTIPPIEAMPDWHRHFAMLASSR